MKNKVFYSILYDAVVGLLAVIAVAIAIYDIKEGITHRALEITDTVIWMIFVIDYFVRFFISKNKNDFFWKNIFDLIAIIPFSALFMSFRIFRLVKLFRFTKLAKFTKVMRLVGAVGRCFKKFDRFVSTNGFKYVIIVTVFVIFCGSLGLHLAENVSYYDAIWWSVVTTSTVGYGDFIPETAVGRFVACVLMIVGIGLISSLTSTTTSYFNNESKNKKSYRENEIDDICERLQNFDELSDEDIEDMYRVLKALKDRDNFNENI